MKRSLALLAFVVLLVAGCGGGGGNKNSSATTSSGGSGSGKKIGLVTDIGGLNDRGFNHLSFVGLQRAQTELGIDQRVFQAHSTQEYVPNLSTFARQGYALTIGVGFTEATAIDTAATNFPNSKFAIVDVDQTEEPHKPKVRDRRRRQAARAAQAEEPARAPLQGAGDRLPRRLSRRAGGEAAAGP